MIAQRISLTVATVAGTIVAGTIAIAPAAQAANWVELGRASTGEMIQLNLDSVGLQRGIENFEFVYQIGADVVAASVNCPTRRISPDGYKAFVPNAGSTTDRMVEQVCALGRRLNRTSKKPQALRAATYSVGSKYIQIAQQGDRFCYQGSSSRGMTIASLTPSPNGMYAINQWKDSFVKQQDADHLLFGSATNMLPYPVNQAATGDISEPLQDCLNTTDAFFQQYEGMRNPVRVK
jgi:hypothetical protein